MNKSPKTVDQYLDRINYKKINTGNYPPSLFSLKFKNFMDMINMDNPESNETPVFHYMMLDQIAGKKKQIANLTFRGSAKALWLNEELITPNGLKKIKDIKIGDIIYDRNGNKTKVTHKSNIFYNQSYKITLHNKQSFIVNEDHLNIVLHKSSNNNFIEKVLTTKELYNSIQDYIYYIPICNIVLEDNSVNKNIDKIGIKSIKPIKRKIPTQCIKVDSNTSSFLLKNGIITHNTSIFFEYLILYIACFGKIDGFGDVNVVIYVSDSIDNGVKSARNNIEARYNKSSYLKKMLPEKQVNFTEKKFHFKSIKGNELVVNLYGASALSLDTKLYTKDSYTTIKDCKVGDYIIGSDGKLAKIYIKSQIFNRPMYKIILNDNRELKVCEEHLNQVWKTEFKGTKRLYYKEQTIITKDLVKQPLYHITKNYNKGKGVQSELSKRPLWFIENCSPIEYSKKDFLLDPYLVGLLLGDGTLQDKKNCVTVALIGLEDDWKTYSKELTSLGYSLGVCQKDKRSPWIHTYTIKNITDKIRKLDMCRRHENKEIPREYFFGSINQRLSLLQGLMDTDGTCQKDGRSYFCSTSKKLIDGIASLIRSLGGTAKIIPQKVKGNRLPAWKVYIKSNLKLFRLERKYKRQKFHKKELVYIKDIIRINNEPSQCIGIDNKDNQFIAGEYFRTHNTGIRGVKALGKRPVLAILDDLISDTDAKSPTVLRSIKDTIYKGVHYALDPERWKIIFSGTPFHKNDPLYEAVESGAWHVNVFPVCEKFPCTKEEFNGAWEDRFSYEYVKEKYDTAIKTGELASFNQELMLRLTSDEDRLVPQENILWYKRSDVLERMKLYNFYITTDFATSSKQTADSNVISVWAYSSQGEWLLVDGISKKQTMDKTMDQLFHFTDRYNPKGVGVETSGQQGGFVSWILQEMNRRNKYFVLARHNGNIGIRPTTDKLSRFNLIVPMFLTNKIKFPEELKTTDFIGNYISEISLATFSGLKGRDDHLDTISMLQYMSPIKPIIPVNFINNTIKPFSVYDMSHDDNSGSNNRKDSYII